MSSVHPSLPFLLTMIHHPIQSEPTRVQKDWHPLLSGVHAMPREMGKGKDHRREEEEVVRLKRHGREEGESKGKNRSGETRYGQLRQIRNSPIG
jgi:hypothetical protein